MKDELATLRKDLDWQISRRIEAETEAAHARADADLAEKRMESLLSAVRPLFEPALRECLEGNLRCNVSVSPDSVLGVAAMSQPMKTIPTVFNRCRFVEPQSMDEKLDAAFLWGRNSTLENLVIASRCLKDKCGIFLCEDGFLKSADTWCASNVPDRFREGCSLLIDDKAFYFDATRESRIEALLNSPDVRIDDDQRARALSLMKRIVSSRLTKYNHQPVDGYVPIGTKGRRKVLVVDQSYGDQSIALVLADENSFAQMLEDAKRDNPGADILVKTHPDSMIGARRGYYDSVKEEGNVFRITSPVNPYSLLEDIEKVYVCTTQLGFEALLAGKEVHVYGMPFYAGWGLTHDRLKCERRTNRRTLEEVFYLFYCQYTYWTNPTSGTRVEMEEALDWLEGIRDEYRFWRMNGHA